MNTDPEERISILEKKVSDLYKAIQRNEPTEFGAGPSAEVRNLVASGDNLRAIKLHVEQTGASLGEAKEAVERVAQGG